MGKYLDFYKKCLIKGRLPDFGLCYSMPPDTTDFSLFQPTWEEAVVYAPKLRYRNPGDFITGYWGSGLFFTTSESRKAYEFTPLRQNIVLLLAAMNDEL